MIFLTGQHHGHDVIAVPSVTLWPIQWQALHTHAIMGNTAFLAWFGWTHQIVHQGAQQAQQQWSDDVNDDGNNDDGDDKNNNNGGNDGNNKWCCGRQWRWQRQQWQTMTSTTIMGQQQQQWDNDNGMATTTMGWQQFDGNGRSALFRILARTSVSPIQGNNQLMWTVWGEEGTILGERTTEKVKVEALWWRSLHFYSGMVQAWVGKKLLTALQLWVRAGTKYSHPVGFLG